MKSTYKNLCLSIIGILIAGATYAQSSLTLYNMKTIPQRINTNPARMSDAKNFLGLPVISSQYVGFGNNAIDINAVLGLLEPNGQDSFTINANRLGDLFGKSNFMSFEHRLDILSFGFRIKKKNYLYVTSSLSQSFRLTYPGDLFDLISDGNGGSNINRTFDLAMGVDFLQYADVGIGFSRKFMDDKLTVGVRYRYLKGINIINTERNALTFKTNSENYDLTVSSDIKINAASSLVPIDNLNVLKETSAENIQPSDFFNTDNTGYSIDLGFDYKITKKINVSASLNNLGKINWQTNTFNVVSKNPGASYTYSGIHFEDVFNEDGSGLEASFRRIADTLKEKFQLEETKTEFSSGIFAEFYLGANYNVSRDHNAGLLIYGSFYQQRINPALTLSWNSKLTNLLALSTSYTIVNNSFTNLGIGLSINGGPFQIYFVSDNLGGLLAPNDVRNLNLRAGFNLAMQRKDPDAKAERDANKLERRAKKNSNQG